MRTDANAIILAGGAATRLGSDKALVHLGGSPLISHVVRRLAPAVNRIIVSGRDGVPDDVQLPKEVTFVPDVPGVEGPLAGIYAGLQASNAEMNIVVACDMPLVGEKLIAMLLRGASESDALIVVPEWAGARQVLLTVYRRGCLDEMRRAIDQGERSPWNFQKRLRPLVIPKADVRAVDPEGLSFFNVNTSDDLIEAEKILARRRQTS